LLKLKEETEAHPEDGADVREVAQSLREEGDVIDLEAFS
jgi:hypothetical protein